MSILSGRPPALACASSTSVLPCPTFRFRCTVGLATSSPLSLPCLDSRPLVALDKFWIGFLVGLPPSTAEAVEEGIFEILRLGLFRSPAGLVAGSVTVRGRADAVAARTTAAVLDMLGKRAGCVVSFCIVAVVFCLVSSGFAV